MTKKRVFYGALTLLGAAILSGAIYINSLLPIITGYAQKPLFGCICIKQESWGCGSNRFKLFIHKIYQE